MLNHPGGSPSKSGRGGKHKTAAGRLPFKCLSDFFPRHKFKLASVGRPSDSNSCKEFNVILTLPSRNNIEFTGKGKLEKLAKHEAASAALKFFEIPGSDKMVKYSLPPEKDREVQIDGITDAVSYVIRLFGPEAKFSEPVQIHVNKVPLWKAALSVQGYTFEETGSSKKKAKEAVAITCIKTLKNKDVKLVAPALKAATIEDGMMELMYKTLREYTNNIPKSMLRFRNIAGIYLHNTQTGVVRKSGLVTVTTGGDTVDNETLSNAGTVVLDCNAQVLAIRAFRLFLLNQISALLDRTSSPEELFIVKDSESGMFKLQDKYQVIMLCNTPPAGDALVFTAPPKRAHVKHFLNCQQGSPGALQFPLPIVKSGGGRPGKQGLRFVTEAHFQTNSALTKPVFVCASDKLTLRNVVGIQGALLAQLIHPVLITKYVFCKSMLVDQEVLKRALYQRIAQHLPDLPAPYQETIPEFATACTKLPADKMYGKWAGWVDCQSEGAKWEVVKLPEGLALTSIPKLSLQRSGESEVDYLERKLAVAREIENSLVPSLLCKFKLFEKFDSISKRLGKDIPQSYSDAKNCATNYQNAKLKVKQAFVTAGLGSWPAKITETDRFRL